MNAPSTPKYGWGQRVAALQDLYNDGSHPGCGAGALLVAQGCPGEVVQVGVHADSGTPVYMVEFGANVVGCFEQEIAPLPAPPGARR
ncbi:nitrogen fixation protein NifZ [Oxalobacteraceae bacterium A2-2]